MKKTSKRGEKEKKLTKKCDLTAKDENSPDVKQKDSDLATNNDRKNDSRGEGGSRNNDDRVNTTMQTSTEPQNRDVPPYAAATTATSGQFQGFLRKVNFPMRTPLDTIFTSTSSMKTAMKANLQVQSVNKGFHLLPGAPHSQLIKRAAHMFNPADSLLT